MTVLPVVQAAIDYVTGLTPEEVSAALTYEEVRPVNPDTGKVLDPDTTATVYRMGREGEDTAAVSLTTQMRAIYTNPWFWQLAAECPNNRLWWGGKTTDLDKRREGAPLHYPDYLMLFLVALAGVKGVSTLNNAVAVLRDHRVWTSLVDHMDQYVPAGWTKLSELPQRNPNRTPKHPTLTTPQTPRTARTRAMRRRRNGNVIALATARTLTTPPSPSTLDYWVMRWRGQGRGKTPLTPGHDYYGLRDRVHNRFRVLAMDQAQAMGVLATDKPFAFVKPDRNQFVGFDGVVFKAPRKGRMDTVGTYPTGTGELARGTKFGITSCRLDRQRHSRVILELGHIHKDLPGSHNDEMAMVLETLPALRDLSDGGLKGLLVDSAVRGYGVTRLQRHGVTVVNYPHAAANPNGGAGRRQAEGRVEKSHLRRVVNHVNDYGNNCVHPIFAVGGELMEVVYTADDTHALIPLEIVGYEQRPNRDGTRRENHKLRINCPFTEQSFIERVPLFHTDPTSNDPDYNWGEVVRVFPPGSWRAQYLYGARNDTEARHADLKARVKHLPADRDGQLLRLLGASMANNGFSWQVHLQAHREPNVIDDTA